MFFFSLPLVFMVIGLHKKFHFPVLDPVSFFIEVLIARNINSHFQILIFI